MLARKFRKSAEMAQSPESFDDIINVPKRDLPSPDDAVLKLKNMFLILSN
jgi:hypothetical protein